MTKWARDNLLTLVLAGLASLLLVGVIVESAVLKSKRSTAAAASLEKAASPEATESVDAEDFDLPDVQEYETIVERPLFLEGRRPGVEAEGTTATATPDTPLTIKLMGVAFTPTDKTALFVDAKGKYKRLKKNGSIEGWTLVDFAPDKVTLQRDDEQRELMLLKPKPKATPGQPQQTPQQPSPQKPAMRPPPPPPVEETGEENEVIEEEPVEEEIEDVEQ